MPLEVVGVLVHGCKSAGDPRLVEGGLRDFGVPAAPEGLVDGVPEGREDDVELGVFVLDGVRLGEVCGADAEAECILECVDCKCGYMCGDGGRRSGVDGRTRVGRELPEEAFEEGEGGG